MTQDTQSNGQDGDRLDSWKKIAAYLGKDVRTAIRWSKDQGMPVYRHAGSKRGAVYAFRSEIDEWIHSDRSEQPRSYQKSKLIGIGAVFGLVLITAASLWLVPDTDEQNSPVADPSWVLITHFDNRSGEERFDGTVETVLRRELSNSRHVMVMPSESVRETLALMNQEPGVVIDTNLGREVCLRRAGNCVLLTGRVEKFDSSYLFSIEVVDPVDGRVVASAEEQAVGEAKVLPAIHYLANWLRENLGEELAQVRLNDQQLEEVTTPSLRALELYSLGMQRMYLYQWMEAEALFRQAVEEDPRFASAHVLVFWALANQGRGPEEEAQSFLGRAMELVDSTSEQEHYFIEGTYYDQSERNYEKACTSYKTLADLFPDHYWAAGNALAVCAGKLGHREAYVRYNVQAAELRADALVTAAAAIIFLTGDFDRARPYVKRLRDVIADGGVPGWKGTPAWEVSFAEFYAAEEFLDKGMLPDVLSELQQIELTLGSMDSSLRWPMTRKLRNFYLALGQFQKAQALFNEEESAETAHFAFLEGDQVTFQAAMEHLLAKFGKEWPDPAERLVYMLRWNMRWWVDGFPLDVLVPLYDPDSAVVDASPSDRPAPEFLSWPKFEAKLQLARGKQLLNQGQVDEAIPQLRSGVRWFRDHGGWEVFQMYFLGAEFLAVAYAEQGDSQAAYRVLEDAAEQKLLVNSFSAPLHQKIQARQALLARELGYTDEAEAIEAELAEALRFADEDHPIVIQIREQQDIPLEIEQGRDKGINE